MFVLSWCTSSLAYTELPLDDVYSQGFIVSLEVHHFVRNLVWQKWQGSKNGHTFQLLSVFHTFQILLVQHTKAAQSSLLCVHVCIFSFLAGIVLA
jgi:hypothetical protein